MTDEKENCANFYSDTGQVVLSMNSMKRKGSQLLIIGKLMGAWESEIYVPPKAVLKTIGKMLNFSVIAYILTLPYWLIKEK